MKEVIVKDADLQKAAMEGMDEFLGVFTKAIYDAIGGELTAENMGELNSDQLTLLSWDILHEELMDGGFVQLIYNGYGPFIFKNPFAKALRQWGLREPSKFIYDAHTLWLKHREEIERELSDEEFMALFEQFPDFEDMDDKFIENEEAWTEDIAHYVDDNIEKFAVIK
ncbi:MAG: DMP19 family protein [Prevotella sp.]|nr:DMP19 family protein [Prevotella sp.]